METWQILEKSAAFIEERGWTQGILESGDTGSVCLLGAISHFVEAERYETEDFDIYDVLDEVPAVKAVADTIDIDDDRPAFRVYRWNDGFAVTQDEVVEKARSVAQAEWEKR